MVDRYLLGGVAAPTPSGLLGIGKVNSIAALKALSPTTLVDGMVLEVANYYDLSVVAGGGGGGPVQWLALSTATADNGIIFAPDAGGTGRWRRIYSGPVTPEMFGCKGDGVTDDSAGYQNFVNLGKRASLTTGAVYRITQQIEVTENLHIEGNGGKVLLDTTNTFFLYNAAADAIDYFILDGVEIETNGAPRATTTTNVIRVLAASYVRIENCNIIGGDVRILGATKGGIVRNNRISGENADGDCVLLYGVYVATGKKYLVTGNTIDTFVSDGVKCGEPTTTVPTPGHYRVTNNDISDCTDNGIDVYDAGRDSVIANNIMHGAMESGLEIKSEPLAGGNADNSNRVVISGNVVTITGQLGALLAGSGYSFTGNVLTGTFSDAVVRVGSTGDNTETATMRDIVISGNIMESVGGGNVLRIRQNKNNIVVTGNSFVGAASTTGTGVLVADTEGAKVSIVGNSFRSLHFGVNFVAYSTARLSLIGNFFEDLDNVIQLTTSDDAAWVCIEGNIAENLSSTPITGTDNPRYIIRNNSWQKAGPVTVVTTVGNVAGGEDDLVTYSLAAATLNRDRQTLRIKAWGETANNSNPKTIKLYFGSAAVLTTALTVSQASAWRIEADIIRTGSSTQTYTSQLVQPGATVVLDAERGNLTQTDTAAITIKCTATVTDGGGGINNDDLKQYGFVIEPVNY